MIYLEWQNTATRHSRVPGLYQPGIFVFLAWLFCSGAPAWSECLPKHKLEALDIAAVSDGDSLRLKDGRRLRLLSVNSPELAKDGREAEAFAEQARALTAKLISPGNKVYARIVGQDRYGRSLATVFTRRDGGHLGEALLQAGLAWHIAVPPSPQPYRDCLRTAEAKARQTGTGIWSMPALQATALTAQDQGFRRIRGRLQEVTESRTGYWLQLEGDAVLRVSKRDLPQFGNIDLARWQGQKIEVRGWLRQRKPPRPGLAHYVMDLRHPDMWQCLNCDIKGQP